MYSAITSSCYSRPKVRFLSRRLLRKLLQRAATYDSRAARRSNCYYTKNVSVTTVSECPDVNILLRTQRRSCVVTISTTKLRAIRLKCINIGSIAARRSMTSTNTCNFGRYPIVVV